jgi:hypothetical protein
MQSEKEMKDLLSKVGISAPKKEPEVLNQRQKFLRWLSIRKTDPMWNSLSSVIDVINDPKVPMEKKKELVLKISPNYKAKILAHPGYLRMEMPHLQGHVVPYTEYEENVAKALKEWEKEGSPVFIFVEHRRLKDTLKRLNRISESGDLLLKPNEWLVPTRSMSALVNRWIMKDKLTELFKIGGINDIEVAGELTGFPAKYGGCVPQVVEHLGKKLPGAKIYTKSERVYPAREMRA